MNLCVVDVVCCENVCCVLCVTCVVCCVLCVSVLWLWSQNVVVDCSLLKVDTFRNKMLLLLLLIVVVVEWLILF